ncbi:MAG: hypothetical protein Q8909_07440 [Bacteroidota bacterium]|nr:hypothetical protein [Bacteroidota bacterium]
MKVRDYCIRVLKHGYRILSRKKFPNPACDCDRQSSNDKIYNLLSSGKPCMISRFGTTEINCINNYLCVADSQHYWKRYWNYVIDKTHTPWWNEDHFQIMSIYSGIFPPVKDTAERFSQRYLQDIPEIDLLACHQYYEKFMPLKSNVIKVQLEMLYPFFVERPWTRALKSKKVLVIHPFEETIKGQYMKRELLFDNPDVFPDFQLITYKAVQSVAGSSVPFKDWFEALAHMESEISAIDFDICIIGCGAYGLPLAAYVKRMGKQAIHLAGGTQLLFGVLGKRWVEQYSDTWEYLPGKPININYRPLFNEHWCYPIETEKPQAAQKVENACYW